ncbi:MAG: PqqD family protein [Myxococcales bacterium]|nr:MAG: PqqD family protein [Myxococcales bacterium]
MVPKRKTITTHQMNDEELALVDEQNNCVLLLNNVGAAVWYLIDGNRSVDAICESIVQTLPVPNDRVKQDVESFVRELQAKHLVEFL